MLAVSRVVGVIVFCALLSGCGAVPPSVPLTLVPLDGASSAAIFSGIADRRAVVLRDASAFAALWAEIHRHHSVPPPLPDVDFAGEIVVGFAMGEQPSSGFAVSIAGIGRTRLGVRIEVEETHPAAGCALLPVITAPVSLARLTRTDEPIEFASRIEIEDCAR